MGGLKYMSFKLKYAPLKPISKSKRNKKSRLGIEHKLTGANPSAASILISKSLFARVNRPSKTFGSAK
jgi:hypothetical protein